MIIRNGQVLGSVLHSAVPKSERPTPGKTAAPAAPAEATPERAAPAAVKADGPKLQPVKKAAAPKPDERRT